MRSIHFAHIVDTALREDLGWGDLSTEAVLAPQASRARATIYARAEGVVAGNPVARAVFARLDPASEYTVHVPDGQRSRLGERIATIHADTAALLGGERVALNFLAHMSGIATATRRLVERVSGLPVRIIDTRKTTPGLRILDKYAVRMGGGYNHRYDLSSAVLLKENHLQAAGGITRAVQAVRNRVGHTTLVQVEVVDLPGLEEALDADADAVLLDNMDVATLSRAVERVAGRIPIEASGGITEATIREIAETGVDMISSGAVTHSSAALDLSMLLDEVST